MNSSSGGSLSSQVPSTPIHDGGRVPPGSLVINPKWKKTELMKLLQDKLPVQFEDGLGVVDFHPSGDSAVIYLAEADIVAGTAYKRKLVKLQKVNEQYKPQSNPFRVIRRGQSVDASVQATVQLIPKLGAVKAKALLHRFGSIEAIATASMEELTEEVGKASAKNVKTFFECEAKPKR